MSSGLEYLGRSAFENCTSLESVSIPGGVAILNDSCFSGCTSLKTIQLGSIRDIGSNAFANCKGLSSVRCLLRSAGYAPLHSIIALICTR